MVVFWAIGFSTSVVLEVVFCKRVFWVLERLVFSLEEAFKSLVKRWFSTSWGGGGRGVELKTVKTLVFAFSEAITVSPFTAMLPSAA